MVFMSPIEYISYVRDINNIYLHVSMPLVMCAQFCFNKTNKKQKNNTKQKQNEKKKQKKTYYCGLI